MSQYAPLLRAQDVFRGNTLVLAPHPDDEIIAVGGTLALLGRAGVPVRVVHLTDGSAGDPRARFADIVSVRREEGRRALAILGQQPAIALGFRDGSLSAALEELVTRLGEEIDGFGAMHLVAPSPLEAHPDHRTAAEAVRGLCARGLPDVLEDVAFYGVNAPVVANLLIDVTSAADLKTRALEAHASQIAYNDNRSAMRGADASRIVNIADPAVSACEAFTRVSRDRLAEFFVAAERLQRILFAGSAQGEEP